jgi:hypothetical protein
VPVKLSTWGTICLQGDQSNSRERGGDKTVSSPTELRSLRRFMGLVGFYAILIPDFSMKAAPQHKFQGKA